MNLNTEGATFNSFGNFTEQFAVSGAIPELLLQSVSDIIRIFPAWPTDKDAKFTNLRAQNGFLVSAEQSGGAVTMLNITSTVGRELKLLAPWPTVFVNGQELTVAADGTVVVSTSAGQTLTFTQTGT